MPRMKVLGPTVFSAKVLIEDTVFASSTGEGTLLLRGHPSHVKHSNINENTELRTYPYTSFKSALMA